jgi:protein farnesyltransferase/geranylgeranyltransferase type-1 subunit alpha
MSLSETFHDIDPIPQDDGPHPVCVIDYPESFQEIMGYLRAILKKDERSERAVELTSMALRFNPANYTTWWFRRQCLASLSVPPENMTSNYTYFSPSYIEHDLKLASQLGGPNPKNYQVWYHRRSLLEQSFSEGSDLTPVEEELEYVASVLKEDAKNYHAWSHRQWILKTVNDDKLWEDELVYSEYLILDDIRNNSAWNQRWFVVHRGSKLPCKVESELEYALEKGIMDAYNECPWRYLVAIVREQQRYLSKEDFSSLIQKCEHDIVHAQKQVETSIVGDVRECIHLSSAWMDILEMKGDLDSYQTAKNIAKDLETLDPIRKKYWKLRCSNLQSKLDA